MICEGAQPGMCSGGRDSSGNGALFVLRAERENERKKEVERKKELERNGKKDREKGRKRDGKRKRDRRKERWKD